MYAHACSFDNRGDTATAWVVTPCGHAGCYECIVQWVEERGTCPVCKHRGLAPHLLYEVAHPPPPPPPPPPQAASTVAEAEEGAPVGSSTSVASGLDRKVVREFGSKIAAMLGIVKQALGRGEKVTRPFLICRHN